MLTESPRKSKKKSYADISYLLLRLFKCKFIRMKMRGARGFTLVEIMIVVAVLGLLAAVAIPNYIRARERSQAVICIANLKRIYDAKALWAMETGAAVTAEPTWADLVPDYFTKMVYCPSGGTYTIGIVDQYPTCDISGHELEG